MPQILRTTLINDEAHATDGTFNFDLPVNPLSAILLTVKALNAQGQGQQYRSSDQLYKVVTNARVAYRGATIIEGSLQDLLMMMHVLTGWQPGPLIDSDNNNHPRALTVPLLFGRRPYDPLECFPATRRGDLVLQLTLDTSVAGFDTFVLQAETIELLEATPTRFTKITTISKVHNAAGDHDVELPISNDILGVGLWSPTIPTLTNYNAAIGDLRLQVDNVETVYSSTNWETLHGELRRRVPHGFSSRNHTHYKDPAIPPVDNYTETYKDNGDNATKFAYLDLDPLGDGQYALRTAGAARVNLRITDDVGSGDAMRVLPVELVQLAAPGATA